MNLMLFLFGLLCNLAVIVGGLVGVAWLAGSLVLYALLDRPLWEVVIVIGASLFVFTRFCVWVVRRRPVGGNWRYHWFPWEGGGGESDEQIRDLEGFIDEIEEELSEARREDDEEEYERLEEIKLDYLRQIEGHQLENKVVVLRRLRKKARKAGRKDEAEEYAKRIKKHEAKLKKRGDRLQDLPLFPKIIAYAMIGSLMLIPAFIAWIIPLALLMQTLEFWNQWTVRFPGVRGGEWMRSPDVMIAVVPGCLALACVGVWVVSWHFSQPASETKKKSTGKKRGGKPGKDTGDFIEKAQAASLPPLPPGEEPPPGAPPPE